MLPIGAQALLVSILIAGHFSGMTGVRWVTREGKRWPSKKSIDYRHLKLSSGWLKKIEIIHKKSLTAG
jgi:hypothetical protein